MYKKTFCINREEVYDVAVVGGGTAGAFAAICAANENAKTVLIEKNAMLGGTMTSGGVNFPGLFHAWGKQIIDGPCWRIIEQVAAEGGTVIPEIKVNPEFHWQEQITLDPFIYVTAVENMCMTSGVSLLYHTQIAFAEEADGEIILTVCGKEGLSILRAKRVIDCTGDANVTEMLGFPVLKSETQQPATLINDISGYKLEDISEADANRCFSEAVAAGEVEESDFQGFGPYHSLYGHRVSMHLFSKNVSDSREKTALEIEARSKLRRIVRFLRSIPGASNLHVSSFAAECGVRETVRIDGEAFMTAENYISGYRYDDAVAYCFYPIDRHIPEGIYQVFLKENVVPTIPYGALIPKNSKYLLSAGRCASGDVDANSAYRVQAACMAMGQAAGVAAAISAKNNISVKNVNYSELKNLLKAQGAIVPDV